MQAQGQRFYVDAETTQNGPGTSWETAFQSLQTALVSANEGDTIWVAAGTYYPTTDNNQSIHFNLKDNMAIYGGFVGDETRLDQRTNGPSSQTILSGDIGVINTVSDNSYHLLSIKELKNGFVERVIFMNGNAKGNESEEKKGGAVYSDNSSITFRHCRFINNYARNEGGAIFSFLGSLTLDSCVFEQNEVEGHSEMKETGGGAIMGEGTILEITKSDFFNNKSINRKAGAIYLKDLPSVISHCTFRENSAHENGGAMFIDFGVDPLIENCVFYKNNGQNGGAILAKSSLNSLIQRSIFRENHSQIRINEDDEEVGGFGGAVYLNAGGLLEITDCLFQENFSDKFGGAFYSRESNRSRTIRSSSFIGNSAITGAAIYTSTSNNQGFLELLNCTLFDNHADSIGGGIHNKHLLKIHSCTITQNQADFEGDDIYVDSSGTIELQNSIVAGQDTDTFYSRDSSNITSLGYNFFRHQGGPNFPSLDPTDISNLSDNILQDEEPGSHGGAPIGTDTFQTLLPTIAILPGSLVHGKGVPYDEMTDLDLFIDQRGYSRFIGGGKDGAVDIGAYEGQNSFILPSKRQVCLGAEFFVSMNPIVIHDSTGGGFEIGKNQTLEFRMPEGFELRPSQGEVVSNHDSLHIQTYTISKDNISIIYDRGFTTELTSLTIQDLEVNATESASLGSFPILRSGGNAFLFNHSIADSGIFALLSPLPTYNLAQDPYEDSFEDDSAEISWIPSDEGIWQWGTPSGNTIEVLDSVDHVWMTGLNDSYSANDTSWVATNQCFDFRGISDPLLALRIWSDTEPGFDGAILQYSTNAGGSWQAVGTDTSGLNWYNSATILANPGSQASESGKQYGWTGRDTSWRRASHSIDHLNNASAVRFRLAFASIENVDVNKANDGFAFDNFFIGERNKKLLLEHFTSESSVSENMIINETVSFNNSSLIAIQHYLTAGDEFYEAYPAGPRGRSLFYGVSEPGVTILHGNDFDDLTSKLTQKRIDSSLLSETFVGISINSASSEPIQIISTQEIEEEVVVYAAIVENIAGHPGILRKFLPDASGTSLPSLMANETKSIPLGDLPVSVVFKDINNLQVLVFAQNYETKEVYQVDSWPLWDGLIQGRKEGELLLDSPNLRLYPNPNTGHMYLDFGTVNDQDFHISITDIRGRLVLTQSVSPGQERYLINLKALPSSIYYLEIEQVGNTLLREKVVVQHQ